PAGELQRDERVGAGVGVQDPQERARLDRNRRRILAVAVQHARDATVAPGSPRLVLAKTVPRRRFQYRFHLSDLDRLLVAGRRRLLAATRTTKTLMFPRECS